MRVLSEKAALEYRKSRGDAYARDFVHYMRTGEVRDLSAVSGSAGGLLISSRAAEQIYSDMTKFSAVASVSGSLITDDGADLPLPGNADSDNRGVIVGEGGTHESVTSDPVFSAAVAKSYKFSSGIVKIPYELLQDSGRLDLEGYIGSLLAERVALGLNWMATNGTGANEPTGLVHAVRTAVTGPSGTATTITYDDLLDLVTSVPPTYRFDENGAPIARFMCSDSTLKALQSVVDGANRPIFDPVSNRIAGFRYVINPDMSSMSAGSKSLLFGNFSEACLVRTVSAITLSRMVETYAISGQVGLLATVRADCVIVRSQAVAAYANGAAA